MTADLREIKAEARQAARARRKELDAAFRAEASAAIRNRILQLPEVQADATRNFALFASVGEEINLWPLLIELIRCKGSVLLPRTIKTERRLAFHRVSDLRVGFIEAWGGIREPDPAAWPETVEASPMDLIIVPGLTFDRRGYRIGYGGGFYDELLARPRACRAVGIVFSPLVSEVPLPTDAWDRPVDAVLTEKGLLKLEIQ